jgi:hypothetical protein
MTRQQVANKIGRHTSTVRRLERDDVLHPQFREGVHWFDPDEVDAVAATLPTITKSAATVATTDEGERARSAFQILGRGATWRALVTELAMPPDEARELAKLFHTAEDVVIPQGPTLELLERWLGGRVVTGESIVAEWRRLRQVVRAARLGVSADELQLRAQGPPELAEEHHERTIREP